MATPAIGYPRILAPRGGRKPLRHDARVKCHSSAAAKQRFSKSKPNLTHLGVHPPTIKGWGQLIVLTPWARQQPTDRHVVAVTLLGLPEGEQHHDLVSLGNVCPAISPI
jgi:hypothetical protein